MDRRACLCQSRAVRYPGRRGYRSSPPIPAAPSICRAEPDASGDARPTQCRLEELLRIGRRAIISFPNFGFWRIRLGLLLIAAACRCRSCLDYAWYETPNIHFCTIKDFTSLCDRLDITIERT